MGKGLKQTTMVTMAEENIQMVNKQMKRCLTTLVKQEMQIKATVKYHFTPTTMAITKWKERRKTDR